MICIRLADGRVVRTRIQIAENLVSAGYAEYAPRSAWKAQHRAYYMV